MRGSALVVGIGIALVLLLVAVVMMGFFMQKSVRTPPQPPVGQQVQLQPAVQTGQPIMVEEVPTTATAE